VVRETRLEIHNFGVLVPLEGKPGDLPGIGFVRIPELTWEHFDDPGDVVYVGQQID
jgi:ribosomal protein S1